MIGRVFIITCILIISAIIALFIQPIDLPSKIKIIKNFHAFTYIIIIFFMMLIYYLFKLA